MGFLFGGGGLQNQTMGLPPGVGPGDYHNQLNEALTRMNGSFDPSNAARGQQQNLIQMLQAAAQGQGPSAAELQMQGGMEQAQKQAAGQAASQRGVNPALAARLASQQQGQLSANAAGQGSLLRAQEQSGARNALAQTLSGVRSQDINQAATNQQGVGLLGGLMNQQQAIGAGAAQQNAGFNQGIFGGLLGGLAGAGSMLAGGGAKPPGGAHGGMVYGAGGGLVEKYAEGGAVSAPTMDVADHFINAVNQRAQAMSDATNANVMGSLKTGVSSFGNIRAGTGDYSKSLTGGDLKGLGVEGVSQTQAPQANLGVQGVSPTRGGPSLGGNFEFGKGGFIPGSSQVDGDSEKNDTVHALLSPGEIVIPRTAAGSPEKAKKFVEELLKNKKNRGGYAEEC